MVKIHEFSGLVCMHACRPFILAQPQARPSLKRLIQIMYTRRTTGESVNSNHQVSNYILH